MDLALYLFIFRGRTNSIDNINRWRDFSNRIGKDIVEFNNKRYYITTKNGWSGAGFEVYDISGGDLLQDLIALALQQKFARVHLMLMLCLW